MARFVLAHPDPAAPEVAAATSLFVDAKHPVARRIAAQAQPDLLVIERTLNDKGVLHKQIAVEDIRKTVAFFGSTAGEGGWRVAIVDAVDELNRSGANALLKVLEEPPQRALLLLVSHSAARVPATLRSRCRILTLRPLGAADVAAALAAATGAAADDPDHCRGGRGGGRFGGARAGVPRRRRLGVAPAGARSPRPAAGARCQGAARARRSAGRNRSAAARRLRRHRQCLAVAAP